MAGFTLVIDGRITEVKKSIAELEQDLKGFRQQLKNTLDVKEITRFNSQIKDTEMLIKRIKNLNGIDGGNIARSSGQATAALIDFSRVVNDVPFGMMGIANNISPMLESFGRLKRETGSAGAAIKALSVSMIGPAGLGLALNLITSAFLIYQNGIMGFNRKTKEARDKAQEFLKTLKDVDDVTRQATASEAGNVARVQALGNIVTDANRAYQERARALNELKTINKAYFGDLDLESSKLSAISAAVNEYTDAIVAQAVVKGFTDEIGRVSTELSKQDKILDRLRTRMQQAQEKLNNTQRLEQAPSGGTMAGAGARISREWERANRMLNQATKEFMAQRDIVDKLGVNYGELNGEIQKATERALKFKSTHTGGGGSTEDALMKQLRFYERIQKVITDINQQVDVGEKILQLRTRILLRDAPKQGLSSDEVQATIEGYRAEFQKILDEQAIALEGIASIKFSPTVRVDIPNNVSFFLTNKGTIETKINDEVAKAVGVDKKMPIITLHQARVRLLGDEMTAYVEGKEKLQSELNKAISDALQGLEVEALAGVGEMLGAALLGGMDGMKNAAKNILSAIGGIVSQLGKHIIMTAIKIKALKEIVEKWIIANPVAAIAAGVGMVALGAMLRNINFSGPKLAQGGITTGPMMATVGEAGQEAIIPLNRLPQLIGQMQGGRAGNITVGLGIQGREIVPWLMEETRRFNRGF